MENINLTDIGISLDDIYRGEDGELHLKDYDYCRYSTPPYLGECWYCIHFDEQESKCLRNAGEEKSLNTLLREAGIGWSRIPLGNLKWHPPKI
ncbi:hypothetical protein M1N20_02985 [Dehalococcoidia bacterium]|nr:hypothetical protein [Dehalococcoidia bacterium]